MKTYEIEIGGKVYQVQAENPEQLKAAAAQIQSRVPLELPQVATPPASAEAMDVSSPRVPPWPRMNPGSFPPAPPAPPAPSADNPFPWLKDYRGDAAAPGSAAPMPPPAAPPAAPPTPGLSIAPPVGGGPMRPEEVSARGANLARQAQGEPLPKLSTRTETQWIDEMSPVMLAPMRDQVMSLVEAGDTRGARDLLTRFARKYAANNVSLVMKTLENLPDKQMKIPLGNEDLEYRWSDMKDVGPMVWPTVKRSVQDLVGGVIRNNLPMYSETEYGGEGYKRLGSFLRALDMPANRSEFDQQMREVKARDEENWPEAMHQRPFTREFIKGASRIPLYTGIPGTRFAVSPSLGTQSAIAAAEGFADESLYGGGLTGAGLNTLFTAGPHYGSSKLATRLSAHPRVNANLHPELAKQLPEWERAGVRVPPGLVTGEEGIQMVDAGLANRLEFKPIVREQILGPNQTLARNKMRELTGLPYAYRDFSPDTMSRHVSRLGTQVDEILDPARMDFPTEDRVDELVTSLTNVRSMDEVAPISRRLGRWQNELQNIFYRPATAAELETEGLEYVWRNGPGVSDAERAQILARLRRHRAEVKKQIDTTTDRGARALYRRYYLNGIDDLIEAHLPEAQRRAVQGMRTNMYWSYRMMEPGALTGNNLDINLGKLANTFYEPSTYGPSWDQRMVERTNRMSPDADAVFKGTAQVEAALNPKNSPLAVNQRIGHTVNPENEKGAPIHFGSTDPVDTRFQGLLPWFLTREGRQRAWVAEHYRGRPYKGERSRSARYTVLPAGSEPGIRVAAGQAGNLFADERLAAYEEAKKYGDRGKQRWERSPYNPWNIGERAGEATREWLKGLFDEF